MTSTPIIICLTNGALLQNIPEKQGQNKVNIGGHIHNVILDRMHFNVFHNSKRAIQGDFIFNGKKAYFNWSGRKLAEAMENELMLL